MNMRREDAEDSMKAGFWRFYLWLGRLLRGPEPSAWARAPEGSKIGDIAVPAIIIVFPLLAFGYLILNWLDADDAVKRREAQERAAAEARKVEAVARTALDAKSQAIFERIEAVRKQENPIGQLRQLIYSREISYVLIRRGTELVFPTSEEWAFPYIEDQRRQLLSVAADLYSRMDPPQGWYAGVSGIVFFRCNRIEKESVCFALDEAALRPDLVSALNSAAEQAPDWAIFLRDTYNRDFWTNRPGFVGDGQSFPLSGPFQGWTLQVSGLAPTKTSPGRLVAMGIPFALFWIYFVLNLSRRQSEKLALAERRKAFLDKIAHDLRTPLSNLKLYCELVAQESQGNPQAEDHCAILSAEVDRLDQVAANAMAFGRSEPPQRRQAVPDDLVQLSLERFNLRFASCKTICMIAASETQPLVFDLSAFERILVNLLDNACKYAPGAIAVATRYEAGFLCLEVSDKGPGVSPSAAVKPSGSGLGLSIVRDLAEANEGEVTLVNGQPGLRVIVTLKANRLEEQLA
jgi:signal transduction histidine kinase